MADAIEGANLAIIPARSGSKGLPNKNILELCGKPLMAHTIEAALESDAFDEVMVSTDSERYAAIALAHGAQVPFLRSSGLSGDAAGSWDVVAEVLERYGRMGRRFDSACLLQPTSPLRTAEDIRAAYRLFREHGGLPVASVCEAEHSPLWCARVLGGGRVEGFLGGGHAERRQDCETFYRLNGAIYIADVAWLEESGFSYEEGCYAYIMSRERSVDIDTKLDLDMAALLMGGSRAAAEEAIAATLG